MKRFFPVIFLASFALFADDVQTQEEQPKVPEYVEQIQVAEQQDAGSLLNGILEHVNQLGSLLSKAYQSSGLSKYVSTESVVVASLACLVVWVGYKKIKAAPGAVDDAKTKKKE